MQIYVGEFEGEDRSEETLGSTSGQQRDVKKLTILDVQVAACMSTPAGL